MTFLFTKAGTASLFFRFSQLSFVAAKALAHEKKTRRSTINTESNKKRLTGPYFWGHETSNPI